MSSRYRMTALEWALLLSLAAMWGSSFLFNKIALKELPHFSVVCLRMIFATAMLAALARATGQSLRQNAAVWRQFAIMGLINNVVPFNLTTYGQSHISAGLASILAASAPLFVVVFAHFMTHDEKVSTQKIGGVAVGLLGVAVIVGPRALAGADAHVFAQLALIGSAIAIALSNIYGRRLRAVPPLVSAAGQAFCSMLVMIPLALFADRPWELTPPGTGTWASVVALAAIGSGISYVVYFRLLATAGATNVSLVNLLIPVSAVLLGVAFLGEHIEPRHMTGMVLIAAGLAAIDGRALPALRGRLRGRTMVKKQIGVSSKHHETPVRKSTP